MAIRNILIQINAQKCGKKTQAVITAYLNPGSQLQHKKMVSDIQPFENET